MRLLKSKVKKIIFNILSIFFKTKIGKFISEKLLLLSMNSFKKVSYKKCDLKFSVPNTINRFRVETFATKEPETLSWIDTFEDKKIFWDIGANIGLYSCYAAKKYQSKVYAFEPSVFNLELLSRNISLNNLTDMITVIPISLTENLQENILNFSNTEWGGAHLTFGRDYTHDGSKLIKKFNYKTIGLSLDEATSLLNLPSPDYIKIDVDGIEHLILKGGPKTLESTKSLLVEIDDKFETQKKNVNKYLTQSGFKLINKEHSKMFDNTKFDTCFNQIWKKV